MDSTLRKKLINLLDAVEIETLAIPSRYDEILNDKLNEQERATLVTDFEGRTEYNPKEDPTFLYHTRLLALRWYHIQPRIRIEV